MRATSKRAAEGFLIAAMRWVTGSNGDRCRPDRLYQTSGESEGSSGGALSLSALREGDSLLKRSFGRQIEGWRCARACERELFE